VGKGKLSKFEEMKTFENVFQPSLEEIFNKDFHLKNSWKQEHFGNENSIVLELGCGKGEYSVGLAAKFPERNFIGVDIKGARIWTGAKQALSREIPNVAFIRTRIEFINSFFGPEEVDEIWLTFPDPQLKKRRNKKRLTAPRFLNSYRAFLRAGGIIHLKTDNAILYNYTLDLIRENNLPVEFATADLYGDKQDDIVHGIRTYYENQFIEEGSNIHYLRFRLPSDKIIIEPEIEDSPSEMDFFSRVYQVVRLIPPGRVSTYGAIARYLGSPQSARMVGWAMNSSHAREDYVPAHRVLNRNGMLTGKHHFGGSRVMEELLESEGIEVVEDHVVDFSAVLWDPNTELI
jgi:tRNA (guanine-N7-)-methyltransferase